jgi:ribosomal protein S18 acetylase RimI-like enzyme
MIFENELPTGCIAYGESRDGEYSDWGEIVSLYIHPDFFREGYGQKLLRTALVELEESGYQKYYLWVLKENLPARKFYEKNGFQCNGDECSMKINNKKLIDVRYVLTVE